MVLLFISGPEIFVVMVVVLLLFGSKQIPEMARGLGKGMREFRKATDEIREEIKKNTDDITDETKGITKEIEEVNKKMNDYSEDYPG